MSDPVEAPLVADVYLSPADEFVFLVEEIPRKLRRLFDARTARFGLTRTQWRALAYIFRTPGMSQTELAKCLELERASVGHVIDQLERLAFVERRAATDNRRVWELYLMSNALAVLPALRAEADALYARLFSAVSSDEIGAVQTILKRMSRNLEHDVDGQVRARRRAGA